MRARRRDCAPCKASTLAHAFHSDGRLTGTRLRNEDLMEQRNDSAGTSGLMDKVRNGAAAQLSTQKDRATDGIGSVVQAVRQSTQHLRDTQHDTIAQYVD